jgi:type IV pilus assembly protein PilQ
VSLKFKREGNTMSKRLTPPWWLPLVMSLVILVAPLSLKSAFSDDQTPVLQLPQERCSMRFVDAEVKDVLRLLAKEYKLNLIISENVGGMITVDFDQVFLEDIFFSVLKTAGLGYTLEGNVILVATQKELLEHETARVKEIEKQTEANKKILEAQTMVSETIKVKYILNTKSNESIVKEITVGKEEVRNLTQLAGALQKMLSDRKGAGIQVVDAANALVITDIPEKVEQIKTLVKGLDQPSAQIMIESRLVLVDADHVRDIGIEWGGRVKNQDLMISGQRDRSWSTITSDTTGTTSTSSSTTATSDTGSKAGSVAGVDLPAAIAAAGHGGSIGFLLGDITKDFLDVQLTALEDKGRGKILASPRVVTQDNQKAYIKIGDEIPYQEVTFSGGATTTTVMFKDAAIELEVSPHMVGDKVFMDIVVARKTPDFKLAIAGNPTLTTQALTTKVSVRNGETLVVGGLTEEEEITTTHAIPFFYKIPLINFFFKNDSKSKSKRELIIFITPTIFTGDSTGDTDAQRISG